MTQNKEEKLKIFELIHRPTGEKAFQAAPTAHNACKQAGWLIGDCYVKEQRPQRKLHANYNIRPLFKVSCKTCPWQYAECRKPADAVCPVRPMSPDLKEWLKHAGEAHLCPFVGCELERKDYLLHQKWLPEREAIAELTPKP